MAKDSSKNYSKAALITAFILLLIASVLFFLSRWVFKTWTGLSMDEILFHLNAPLTGTGDGIIEKGVFATIVPVFFILLADIILLIVLKRKSFFRKALKFQILASLFLLLITIITAWNKLELASYISNRLNVSSFIEENYVAPSSVEITFPQKKRNLIYIYLESVETTFASVEKGGAFERDCIEKLSTLALENQCFAGNSGKLNGGYVMPECTYTMAAIFAHSMGIPMKLGLGTDFADHNGNFNSMDTQSSFFPGVEGLGDILEKEGYNQVFMLGSDVKFGGRELFFSSHGQFEIDDYNWAVREGIIPEDYYVFWGYEDSKLFENAKDRLLSLADEDEPFNLTMLTVDTHFEDGYICDKCTDEFGTNRYANVLSCSSNQVYEFIEWVKEQDFYEDTAIVLAGDHLTMDSDFCEDVPDDYERKVYTAYINSQAGTESDDYREYTTLDNLPTTLAAMGCKIEGERLGLGTNLFSQKQTLTEEYGYDKLVSELSKRSEFVENMSNLDKYDDELLRRKGLLPKARLEISSFDEDTGKISVNVYNIKNVYSDIEKVSVRLSDENGHFYVADCIKAETEGCYSAVLDYKDIDTSYASLCASVKTKDGEEYQLAQMLGDMSLKSTNINTYLGSLYKHRDKYSIFVAVKYDASRLMSIVMNQGIINLGFNKPIIDHYRYSYIAILSEGKILTEELSRDELSHSGSLPGGEDYSIISQGGFSGAGGGAGRYLTCSIKIDGVQYAVQKIGLNIVVYDNDNRRVVDSVCFNTNNKLKCSRADLVSIAQEQAETETEE